MLLLRTRSVPKECVVKVVSESGKRIVCKTAHGATEKLPGWDKPRAKTSAWSYDMEGHARKCVERYCELANTKTEQLYKVSRPCFDDHQKKGRVGEQS